MWNATFDQLFELLRERKITIDSSFTKGMEVNQQGFNIDLIVGLSVDLTTMLSIVFNYDFVKDCNSDRLFSGFYQMDIDGFTKDLIHGF